MLVDEDGTLAGSAIDMATTVRNAVDCWASTGRGGADGEPVSGGVPGLGGELGRIAPGYRANLALVDDALVVKQTWIDGKTTA